jgi:cytochrome c553
VSCATDGTNNGCHVSGGHHANEGGDYVNDGTDGSTTVRYVSGGTGGASYRFLSGSIKGAEDGDWEWSNGIQDHNIYAGVSNINGAAQTITSLCVSCHGDFHGTYVAPVGTGTGPTNPWYRHPTDIGLFDANVDTEHQSYDSYAPITPVGTPVGSIITTANQAAVMTNFNEATAGNNYDRVTCVSCHRAHGSENSDALRWSYNTMNAGGGAVSPRGCFKCHSEKD